MSISFNIERSWFASRQTTGFPLLSCSTASSWKERVSIFLRTGCSSLRANQRVSPFCHDLSLLPKSSSVLHQRNVVESFAQSRQQLGARDFHHDKERISPFYHDLGLGFGWLDWELLDCWATSSLWLSNNFWTQCFHPVMFQGNLWRRTRRRIYFLEYDFSSFQPNNFRDTISWEGLIKNDDVRLCLIELQSLLLSKIDADETWIALNANVRRDNSICVPLIMMRNKDC